MEHVCTSRIKQVTIDSSAFRKVMANFASGITILTTRAGEGFYGMTASAVASVSLEPTLVLACIERSTLAHRYVQESGDYVLNILAEDQRQLSQIFAMDESARERYLKSVPYYRSTRGLPILNGALAYLECEVVATHPGGDHSIFIGEVHEAAVLAAESPPLIYFRSAYHGLRG